MEIEHKRQKKRNLIYILVAGGLLLLGIILWVIFRKNSDFASQINLGEQQRQQVRELSSQLVGNIIDNQNNFNQLTNSPNGTRREIEDIEEFFLSNTLSYSPQGINQTIPISSPTNSQVIEQSWYELRPFIIAALQNSTNSILENCQLRVRNDIEKWLRWELEKAKGDYNKLLEEYLKAIKYSKTVKELFEKYSQIRSNLVIDKVDRSKELIAKGYSEIDIVQLKDWNLLDQDFPNLYDDKRIGVTNALSALSRRCWEGGKEKQKIVGGLSRELLLFLKPSNSQSSTVYFPIDKIEIAQQNSVRKIFKDLLNSSSIVLEGIKNYDIYILRVNSSHDGAGPSSGVAHFLALFSALNKIPLPRNLASTATIEGERVGGIGGLQHKLEASVKNGIDTFILSCENKKDENQEQSFDDTPLEVESKIKQVHFISQVDQIEIALREILKEPSKKIIHSCGNEIPKNEEPELNQSSSISSEQLLSLATEFFSKEVPENQRNFKNKLISCFISGETENIIEEAMALRTEYLKKLEKNSLSSDKTLAKEIEKIEKQIAKKTEALNNKETTEEEKRELKKEIDDLRQRLTKLRENSNQNRTNLEK